MKREIIKRGRWKMEPDVTGIPESLTDEEKMKMLDWTQPPRVLFYPGTGKDILRVLQKFGGIVDRFYFNDSGEAFPDLFTELQDTEYFSALLDDPAITFNPRSKKIIEDDASEYLAYTLFYGKRKLRFCFYHCDHTDAMEHMKKNKIKISFLVLMGAGGEGGSYFLDVFEDKYKKRGMQIVKTYYKKINGYGIGPEWIPIGGWELFESICRPRIVVERYEDIKFQESAELRAFDRVI
jgi:hypothetical protein